MGSRLARQEFRMKTSPPARIAFTDFDRWKASFPAEVKQDADWTTWTLATSIIGHFLGKQWVLANIPQDESNSRPPGFFRMDFSSPENRQLKATRILDFAETLFNLQDVGGFERRINQMRTSDPESALAELDFGRFLYIHDVDFCFVTPMGQKGQDYDCAITYQDGRSACADAKCRIENSEIQPRAIRHALETARKRNLPKDEPGIVFVKVPQSWLEFEHVRHGLARTGRDFLRQTERIVLVVFYCSVHFLLKGQELVAIRHLVEEIENPKHRFDGGKDWRLFRSFKVPREWNGMPPKWQRIFSRGSNDPAYGTATA
jgi:hypothetical protein